MNHRFGGPLYRKGADTLRLDLDVLLKVESWKPDFVFTCSMSDLFLEEAPDYFLELVFYQMENNPQHTFQVLTKRSERMMNWTRQNYTTLTFPKNIWLGVSVENQDYMERVDHLKKTPASLRFISFEPLLGLIELEDGDLDGIDWVIVGGESGGGARKMDGDWARAIRDHCVRDEIPFFFKQWGAHDPVTGKKVGKKKAGGILDGRVWDEMPTEPRQLEGI